MWLHLLACAGPPLQDPPLQDAPLQDLQVKAAALAAVPVGHCAGQETFSDETWLSTELLHPWLIATAADAAAVMQLVTGETWQALGDSIAERADDTCCSCCDEYRYPDDCVADCETTQGWSIVGQYNVGGSGSSGSASRSFTRFGMAFADGDGSYEALAHGMAGTGTSCDCGTCCMRNMGIELREGHANTGIHDLGHNGSWVRNGRLRDYNDAPVGTVYTRILASDTLPLGDFCAVFEMSSVETCEDEPVGILRIEGASVVELRLDGDVECDGCEVVTVDGRDLGTACLGG